jgi:hypothetical protein
MLTANFYWSLLGVLMSVAAALFLLNDLKNRRTYLIAGDGSSIEQKVIVRRDSSPLLFMIIVVGIALCTAFMLLTCSLLFVGAVTSIDLIGPTDRSQVVLAFIPYGLVTLYVLEAVSIRVFARWWDNEAEGPQTLGLGSSDESKARDD